MTARSLVNAKKPPPPKEAAVNRWPVNQAALRWLKEAKYPVNPQAPYVVQLAVHGLEAGEVTLPQPLAPNHPLPEEVSRRAYSLLKMGGWQAMQATQRLFSNPNLTQTESMDLLLSSLAAATSPAEASAAVLETLSELMVATSLTPPSD